MESPNDRKPVVEQREPVARVFDDGLAELIRRLGAAQRRKINSESKRNGPNRTN